MIRLTVNGVQHELGVEPRATLLDILREKLKLISVHRGCEEGECGACTVLFNGKPVYSCLILAPQADGAEITTLEGLVKNEKLHPLMSAFIENHAIQCGYCTPGMVLTAYYLLNTLKVVTDETIRKGLEGNLCRCTGYMGIIEAIKSARQKKDAGDWW